MQGFDWEYCMSAESQAAYASELRALQAELAGRQGVPKLYVGLEQDALVPAQEKAKNRTAFDYIIGSTHYFPEPLEGAYVAVDGSRELLKHCVDQHFGGDPQAMAAAYYTLHASAVENDRPDIVGHFDLVRKYAAFVGLNTGSAAYRDAALSALEHARRGCTVLEVNTGGIARGYETEPFPAPFLLAAWRDMGGEVTLTSDCHDARYLDCAFDETSALLKATGFKRLLRLGTGTQLWDEVTL